MTAIVKDFFDMFNELEIDVTCNCSWEIIWGGVMSRNQAEP